MLDNREESSLNENTRECSGRESDMYSERNHKCEK